MVIDELPIGPEHRSLLPEGARPASFRRTVTFKGTLETTVPVRGGGSPAIFKPKFPLHVGWRSLAVPVLLPCEGELGLQVLLNDPVEGCCLGMAAAIRGRSASLRLDGHVGGTVQSCRRVLIDYRRPGARGRLTRGDTWRAGPADALLKRLRRLLGNDAATVSYQRGPQQDAVPRPRAPRVSPVQ